MARVYTIATAALTLDTTVKWLDNLLSHNRVPGVIQERQGVSRRLTVDGLLTLALVSLLVRELDLSASRAIMVAEDLIKNEGHFATPGGLGLGLDLASFRRQLLERLERAVEIAPIPMRGRPPQSKTGRLD